MRFRVPVLPLLVTVEWSPRRMGRLSLGLRDSILLVALAAFAIMPWVANRKDFFQRRITFHSLQEYLFQRKLPQYERRVEEARMANRSAAASDLRAIAEYRELASYHRGQILRYQRAIARPWMSVSAQSGSPGPTEDDLSQAAKKWEQLRAAR